MRSIICLLLAAILCGACSVRDGMKYPEIPTVAELLPKPTLHIKVEARKFRKPTFAPRRDFGAPINDEGLTETPVGSFRRPLAFEAGVGGLVSGLGCFQVVDAGAPADFTVEIRVRSVIDEPGIVPLVLWAGTVLSFPISGDEVLDLDAQLFAHGNRVGGISTRRVVTTWLAWWQLFPGIFTRSATSTALTDAGQEIVAWLHAVEGSPCRGAPGGGG